MREQNPPPDPIFEQLHKNGLELAIILAIACTTIGIIAAVATIWIPEAPYVALGAFVLAFLFAALIAYITNSLDKLHKPWSMRAFTETYTTNISMKTPVTITVNYHMPPGWITDNVKEKFRLTTQTTLNRTFAQIDRLPKDWDQLQKLLLPALNHLGDNELNIPVWYFEIANVQTGEIKQEKGVWI